MCDQKPPAYCQVEVVNIKKKNPQVTVEFKLKLILILDFIELHLKEMSQILCCIASNIYITLDTCLLML